MSVTVAVSSPVPGQTFVPGAGPAMVETAQAGDGETGDFAAMIRDATGTPAAESEDGKPGKALGVSEGKKVKKDKVKGEGDLPVEVRTSQAAGTVTMAAPAPVNVPASVPLSSPAVQGSAARPDDASPPLTAVAKASERPRPEGEVKAREAEGIAQADPAAVIPIELADAMEPGSNAVRTAASEPKERAGEVETTDVRQAPKVQAPPAPSGEIGPARSKEAAPSPAEAAPPKNEPTRTRAGRLRQEGDAVATSPNRHTGETAPQPVRAGEATALLAVARRAANGAAPVAEEGVATPSAPEEKSAFPAKGAGAAQASPVAIAAVQAGPAAGRTSATPPKAVPEQPETRAASTSDEQSVSPMRREDTPATLGSAALPQPPAPSSIAGPAPTAGTLSGALGEQVVDMGVSGQWIDDIARQIATIAANPGHGSFRIASEALGAVRVDLTPGKNGSDVVMTVDNDAARAALSQDTDRLMQDARLASVRLGDVRVERAIASDAPRSDTSQQQGGGQGAPAHAQAAMGQGGDQGGQHSAARPDTAALMSQQQGGNSPKTPFIKSVLQESGTPEQSAQDRGRSPDRARYA